MLCTCYIANLILWMWLLAIYISLPEDNTGGPWAIAFAISTFFLALGYGFCVVTAMMTTSRRARARIIQSTPPPDSEGGGGLRRFPPPPPELSPACMPIGPRHPWPLVAHAAPPLAG
jgi:hypothetical protein